MAWWVIIDDSARFPRFQFLPPGEPPRRSHLFQGGDPTKVEGGMRGVPPHSYYAPRPQPRQKIPASDCDMNLGCTNNSLHFRKNYKHENHFHLQYPVIEMDN